MIKNKKIASILALAFVTNTVCAGDAGMQQLFDDIGAYGNATGPGAYRSQGMNVVTGGSLFMRTPQKNYKPVSITLPSLKYGCGGIDLYAGSFSFISKTELVSMMKNIGSSAVSYAFKLALDSISPEINKTLTELQQTVQALNSTNINSCEAGAAIARGTQGDWQSTQAYFAKVAGPVTGMFSDHSEARAATQGDTTKVDAAISSVTDVPAKTLMKPGNIAWRALSQLTGLDNDDRKILMSLTGTVIVPDGGPSVVPPEYHPAKALTIQQFIHGNENGKIPVYGCSDGFTADQCLTVIDEEIDVKPYFQKVQTILNGIADKFRTNTKLTPEEIKFINVTGIPIYKALAVSTAAPNAGLDLQWIANYSYLIAAEYAFQYIVQTTQQVTVAYSQSTTSVSGPAKDSFNEMLRTIDKLRTASRAEVHDAYSKVDSMNKMADQILYMQRNLMGNLPANIAGNLRFASVGR
jgi:conjugative transfer pilus assembly protein TraH